MQAEGSAKPHHLARGGCGSVVAAIDGGTITGDAGALLPRAADRAIDLVGRFVGYIDGRPRADTY